MVRGDNDARVKWTQIFANIERLSKFADLDRFDRGKINFFLLLLFFFLNTPDLWYSCLLVFSVGAWVCLLLIYDRAVGFKKLKKGKSRA